jgi:acetoin utilization deacetylase AcuC-like enzyme
MTLLYTDPIFLEHHTGDHVEVADRLRAITSRLERTGLARRCQSGEFKPLAETAVARTHDPRVILRAKQVCQHGGGQLDPDTVVSPRSFEVALAAAGAAAAAVDAVLLGREQNALCLVRPPGHHATPSHSMGFCIFNTIALAAQHARVKHQLGRVLIVDWDVHHGNGTQDIFYAHPEVFFYSVHRYPFYPGTGSKDETGTGPGLGYTLNVPLRFGTSRPEFREAFASNLERIADKFKPEMILLSAGFDAHAEDPIGSLGLEVEDFAGLTRGVMELARVHAAGRIVSCLEGGYNQQRLAECVEAHLIELLRA